MKKNRSKILLAGTGFLVAFVLWTALLIFVDVRPIGPNESCVGFATINEFVHNNTGVNMLLYTITDWLGVIPIGTMIGFGVLGLVQWIKRKSLRKVDKSILLLGIFYVIVMAVYAVFEIFVINYRPVIINEKLEASYPSSTTMMVMCVMPTAILQLRSRINNPIFKHCLTYAIVLFTAIMLIGRLISGVHWFSDIIGGLLFSVALTLIYHFTEIRVLDP